MQPAGIGFEEVVDDEIICNNNANADHQKQMVFMANLVPERLKQNDFSDLLRRYPSYIRDVCQKAENERFEDLPRKLLGRQPEPFLTKEELVYMNQWIQKQGTFLTNSTCMAITKQVNQNTNSAVIDITKDAFQNYKLNEDLDEAFEILRKLKGVDNTSASLLLSVAYPKDLPHFSRPLYQWIYWDQASGWNQQFEWTRDIYRGLLLEMERLKEKYSATAIDIEKVVIVLKHESALEVLRKEYITESLIDRDRDITVRQKNQTYVYKVLRKGLDGRTGNSAVKLHPKSPDVARSRNRLLAEVSNSYELSKPEKNRNYFVELIGWNETPHYLILAMEFIELGNLEDNLEGVPWKEQDIKETTKQLLEGLRIMHENGIAHRSLSPWNILVVSRPPHTIQIKITDFGISKRLSTRGTTSFVTDDIGSYSYKAPEVARRWIAEVPNLPKINTRHIYTYKADLWSLGCVIFRISAGKPFMKNAAEEFSDVEALKSTVKTIEASLTPFMSAGGIKLVKKLIVIDPKRRYSAENALKGLAKWDIYKGSLDKFSKVTDETPNISPQEITYKTPGNLSWESTRQAPNIPSTKINNQIPHTPSWGDFLKKIPKFDEKSYYAQIDEGSGLKDYHGYERMYQSDTNSTSDKSLPDDLGIANEEEKVKKLEDQVPFRSLISVSQSLPELVDMIFNLLNIPSMEEPIPPKMTRIKYNCGCGAILYYDVPKQSLGSTNELLPDSSELSKTRNNTPIDIIGVVQGWVWTLYKAIEGTWSKRPLLPVSGGSPTTNPTSVPSSNIQLQGTQATQSTQATQENSPMYLLLCLDRGEDMHNLFEEPLPPSLNDQKFFDFLREQYKKHRSFHSWLTIRWVNKVYLVHFKIDINDLTIPHDSDGDCTQVCACFPQKGKAGTGGQEYHCSPVPEKPHDPSDHPIIRSRVLSHYFKNEHIFTGKNESHSIFNQIPKKTNRLDRTKVHEVNDAWGISFEEGWHWRTIYLLMFLTIWGSLTFGVVWAVIKGSAGDAFTVASFGTSVGSAFIALLAWQSSKV